MNDKIAHARAQEAEQWIEEAASGDGPVGDLFTRAFVIDAYLAGRDFGDDDAREARMADRSVVIEAAQLLRSYQSHHLVKARNFIDDHRDQWDCSDQYSALAQESLDKANRNGEIAARLEKWILGLGSDQPSDINPAEVLRSIAEDIAEATGLGVDHPAFDQAIEKMDEAGFKPPTHGDYMDWLIDGLREEGADLSDELDVGSRITGMIDGWLNPGKYKNMVEDSDELDEIKDDGTPFTMFDHNKDGEARILVNGFNSDAEKSVFVNGMRYIAEDIVGEDWQGMVREVISQIDESTRVVEENADQLRRYREDLEASGVKSVSDITERLPKRKEAPNLKPIKEGPLGDPKVVDALVNVTSQDPDAEVQAAPHRLGGVADLLAFRVTTGDPRFQPDKPVTINGFLYRPVDVPTERKE